MPNRSEHAATLARRWDTQVELTPDRYLSAAARAIGEATSADSGWAPAASGPSTPIAMAGGIPDAGALPRAELLAALRVVIERSGPEALRYGGTLGYEGLRRLLAEKSEREDNLSQGPQNFLLTNGSSAAIDLICRAFINAGDVIVAESPSYSGSLRTLRGHQARLVPVPLDAGGIVPDALEQVLGELAAAGTPAKFIYSVPDFHNPSGVSLRLERRRPVLEIAARYGALFVEDDAYADIYFGEAALPSMYALAGGAGVLRVGTFSKTVATGLRVGWIQGREDFVSACNLMRFDMGGSPLIHRMLAEYVSSGAWETHILEMRRLYAQKCDILSEALIDECEPYIRFQRPAGGFFIWLECAAGIDAGLVARAAAAEGLVCVPGRSFYLDRGDVCHLRLAFSTAAVSEMSEAARRLRLAFEQVAG